VIYKALSKIKDEFGKYPLEILKNHAWKMMEDEGLRPEYLEIVDGNNLQSVVDSQKSEYIVVLTAAWANDIRLIDNLILKSL
jgi:pantoate--beta-alanine ligase